MGGGDNGDKYIFIYINPYIPRGFVSPKGGDKLVTNGDTLKGRYFERD